MRQLITVVALLTLSSGLPLHPVAAQDAETLFAAASAAFEDSDYLQALALFQNARDAGIQGPSVHYNIGVCQYRLGNYAGAENAFRTVADGYPAMRGLALYNLGLVRLRQGRDAEAAQLFSQARDDSSDQKVTQLAETMLQRMTPAARATRPPRWRSMADFNIGYDDNVALIDEASLPAGQSVDSAFTELFGAISGPLTNVPGFRFDGSAYAVSYADAGEYDQVALRLGGAYQWTTADWYIEAGPHLNRSTLDGDGFEQRLGADLRLWRALTSSTSLSIRFSHHEIDSVESRFAFIDGSREQFQILWNRRGQAGRVTLGYDLELNDRDNASVSPTRNRLWARYRYNASPEWAADVRLALRSSSYDDLTVVRDEDLADLSLGYVRHLSDGWQLSGRYRWSDNDSNIGFFAYSRNRLTIGLTKNF